MRRTISPYSVAGLLLATLAVLPARAGSIPFTDNLDAVVPGSYHPFGVEVLSIQNSIPSNTAWDALGAPFNVLNGSDCFGGVGGCFELLGGNGIVFTGSFTLMARQTYQFGAYIAGRPETSSGISFGLCVACIGNRSLIGIQSSAATGVLAANSEYAPFYATFTPATNEDVGLYFQNSPADGAGSFGGFVDSISLQQVNAVPEIDSASAVGAMTLVLGGLAVIRGRRRSPPAWSGPPSVT